MRVTEHDVIKIPGSELKLAYNHYSLHSTDVTKSKSKIRPLCRKFDSIEGRRKVLEEKLVMHATISQMLRARACFSRSGIKRTGERWLDTRDTHVYVRTHIHAKLRVHVADTRRIPSCRHVQSLA